VTSKVLVLGGAAATILSAFLTWVTVTGLAVTLDLDLISTDVGAGNRTVAGTDTVLWPAIVALGLLAAILGALGVGRRLLVALGLVVAVAGALLLAYMANVIELETRDGAQLEQGAARSLLDSTVGPGTPLLLAGGVLIALGGLARARARS
jgi:energy-converting hydrogenase Eha subunit A